MTFVIAVLVGVAAYTLVNLLPALLVLLMALMIVGTLNPTMHWLQGRGFRRGSAIAIVFGTLSLVSLAIATLTVPALVAQVSTLIEHEPQLRSKLVAFLASYPVTQFLADVVRDVHYDALIKEAGADVLALSARVVEIVAYSARAFFLALYMMIDSDRLRGALFLSTPRLHHVRLSRVLLNLETIVGGYIRG
ncbi:MAG: AI-2E family transporter [Pseudomonadota bacterium]